VSTISIRYDRAAGMFHNVLGASGLRGRTGSTGVTGPRGQGINRDTDDADDCEGPRGEYCTVMYNKRKCHHTADMRCGHPPPSRAHAIHCACFEFQLKVHFYINNITMLSVRFFLFST